jgi:hypothetical protein
MPSGKTLYDRVITWLKNQRIVVGVLIIVAFIVGLSSLIDAFKKIGSVVEKPTITDPDPPSPKIDWKLVKIVDSKARDSASQEAYGFIKQSLNYLSNKSVRIEPALLRIDQQNIRELFPDTLDLAIVHWSAFKYDGYKDQSSRDSMDIFIQRIYKEAPSTHFIVFSRAFHKIEGRQSVNTFADRWSQRGILSTNDLVKLQKQIQTIPYPEYNSQKPGFTDSLRLMVDDILFPSMDSPH